LADPAELECRLKLVQLYGEIDPVHLVRDHLLEGHLVHLAADDSDFVPRDEGGFEKGEPLDMVPVGVGDEDMGFDRPPVLNELFAEISEAGAGVEDDELVFREPHLDTGCISAVPNGTLPWGGDRSPGSPEFQPHGVTPLYDCAYWRYCFAEISM